MFVMKNMRKLVGATLLASCAALALGSASAAAETIDQVKEKGELTIGMLVDFPPYGIMNTENKPDGYDADVARQLAKDLGVKLNIVPVTRSEEHTSELQSLMRISYAVFCLKKKKKKKPNNITTDNNLCNNTTRKNNNKSNK